MMTVDTNGDEDYDDDDDTNDVDDTNDDTDDRDAIVYGEDDPYND